MNMFEKKHYAVVAGSFASAASLFGKLISLVDYSSYQDLVLKGALLCLMIICNAAVWTFFVKALNASSSTLIATITSATTNYILSVLFGTFIFGETTGILWWMGFVLILIGLYVITANDSDGVKAKDA
uniref:Putative conserved plasma membrane protein n=1 Tax=Xenopsylla cheopis TaxID=163159 RepID=A0A6M2DVI8_XENCH